MTEIQDTFQNLPPQGLESEFSPGNVTTVSASWATNSPDTTGIALEIKAATQALPTASNDRGFTGHEHMDEFGVINMNARVYDPRLGDSSAPIPSSPMRSIRKVITAMAM